MASICVGLKWSVKWERVVSKKVGSDVGQMIEGFVGPNIWGFILYMVEACSCIVGGE